jgi:hypothetical protein
MDIIARLEGDNENPGENAPSSYHSFDHPCGPPSPDEMTNGDKHLEPWSLLTPFKKWREKQKQQRSIADLEKNGENQEISEDEQAEARARNIRNNYLPCHYFDYIGGTSTGG